MTAATRVILSVLAGCMVGHISAVELSATTDDLDLPNAALATNDECENSAVGQCALSALQRKGAKITSQIAKLSTPPEQVSTPPESIINEEEILCQPMCGGSEGEEEGLGATLGATLGAGPDEGLGGAIPEAGLEGSRIQNYAANCWYACGGAGPCDNFCGKGNACCRAGAQHDPAICQQVNFFPVITHHTCVQPQSPGEGSQSCEGRGGDGATMTLYHQTGCGIGAKILADGFLLGSRGWCGGGIYFADSPKATETKAIGKDSHKGFMIEAVVRVGHLSYGDRHCKSNGHSVNGATLHGQGFDTMTFNPGDGPEYIVYCSSQVVSTRRIPYTSKTAGSCPY
ncbi:unnamed protein product [Polarella glacialis]|uniref:PARP n=1 Tax=Polarella glacialis TaxID=89957 RepID=A0A813HQK2_POLGL|nr:unnamed protein product [Polarella glacialis]CAE8678317.1 unnamed protein product [Polarella glacialis]|eukprot:CAMPEP_0115100088 /NCGR_PEP_ID=MMETSP0227-20121206/32306_1 /TAXON_ID=89957 /ORGANISM="Polarella glacialis, Strain CCMP 1383" /LENGTH=341 /DNA_ID=CAMNT_0002495337 /DNA_START=74 /DNA_END=1099 /DNA_ORIENTATION=-